MSSHAKFSNYIKRDAEGNHHIRMGKSIYVVKTELVVGRLNGVTLQIRSIQRLSNDGTPHLVSPSECFEKGWMIRTIHQEIQNAQYAKSRVKRSANSEYFGSLKQRGQFNHSASGLWR